MRKGYSLFGRIPDLIGDDFAEYSPSRRDEYSMSQAVLEGMTSCGLSEPNPAVGCVIVNSNGVIVSRGSTEMCGKRHAERVAIEALPPDKNPNDLTLYCTLEPCAFTGRQPPCTDLIVRTGIKRCVIGVSDPDIRVNGRGLAILRSAGIEVKTGVLWKETAAWHIPFLMRHSMERPLIVGKWAQTLDGQLAFDSGTPRWVSCNASRTCAHWLRQRYDAVLIGAGTAIADKPTLTVRNSRFPIHRHPVRILFDPSNRVFQVPEREWHVLRENLFSLDTPVLIFCKTPANSTEKTRWKALEQLDHVHLNLSPPRADFLENMIRSLSDPSLTAQLGRPINSILVEGGPRLLSLMLQSNLIDMAHIFQSSLIGGGEHTRLMVPVRVPNASSKLDVVNTVQVKTDVLIELANRHVQEKLGLEHSRSAVAKSEARLLQEVQGAYINV